MQKYFKLFKRSGHNRVPCFKAPSIGFVLSQVNEIDWEGTVSQEELMKAMDAFETTIEGNGTIRGVTHITVRQYDDNSDFTEVAIIETKNVVIHIFKIEQEWMFSIPGSDLSLCDGYVYKSDMPSL